jgi:MSHA biogenesis protein MshO
MRPSRSRCLGFTLVELVVSITLLAILATAAVPMLRLPMSAYMDAALRSDLRSEMDTAAAKLRDDLAQAMPNSVRVWPPVGVPRYLEYLEVRAYGRYRAGAASGPQSCPATCGTDELMLTCSDSCFTTLGPLLGGAPVPGADYVVVTPAGGNPYANGAATPPGDMKARLQSVTPIAGDSGSRITITPHQFLNHSANRQFYIVATPVTYECNPVTQRLTRYWGYPIAALQPTAFGAGVARAPLATTVSDCRFNYTSTPSPTGAPSRGGVVSMWLRFTRQSTGVGFSESVESLAEFSVKEPA